MDGGLKRKNLPKEEYGYFLELRNLIKIQNIFIFIFGSFWWSCFSCLFFHFFGLKTKVMVTRTDKFKYCSLHVVLLLILLTISMAGHQFKRDRQVNIPSTLSVFSDTIYNKS